MPSEPKISIIVATRNAEAGIKGCIDSIIRQTYPSYEILIQDALSTDGTLTMLDGYDGGVIKIASEADTGIYDAWNRALARAAGQWIMFVGADDRMAHKEVLSNRAQLLAHCSGQLDLVCGRIAFLGPDGRVRKQMGAPWSWPDMLKRQTVPHIGLMHNRRLFETFGPFSTRYRISGDYEFLLRLGPKVNALFVDEIEFLAGLNGVSQTQLRRVLLETFQIQTSRSDIGYASASANLLLTGAKALGRRYLTRAFAGV